MSITTVGPGSAKAPDGQADADFGMAAGTAILTMEGVLPVEFLSLGDRLVTRSGVQRLREIEVTVLERARMVRIGRGVLGNGRPAEDLLVRPDQPILIRDWRAKALYGKSQALVPAARLADGEFIRAEVVASLRVYTLRLDEAAVIYAGGTELLCAGALADA